MSKLQLHVVKWTVICTIPATVLAAVLFKLAGVDDQGWGGGIGAAIGIALGNVIATKTFKGDASADA